MQEQDGSYQIDTKIDPNVYSRMHKTNTKEKKFVSAQKQYENPADANASGSRDNRDSMLSMQHQNAGREKLQSLTVKR